MKSKVPTIAFEVTSDCNLNCRYCYNHWKCNNQVKSDINNYKTAKNTLNRLFKTAQVDHIAFTGGEPLVAERFLELVLYVRMKGAKVTIISNGTYNDFSVYKQLVNLGVSLFELPIHSSNPDNHDYLTNETGSWNKSVTTIRKLIKTNAKVLAVIVLTKANYKDVSDTLKYIHSLGIERVMLNRLNIGGEVTKNIENLLTTREELNNAYYNAMITAKELKISLTSNVCTPICVLNPDKYSGISFSHCSYEITKRPITINFAGDVRSCNHSPVIIGNIFKEKLIDILDSSQLKDWENTIPDFCKDCKEFFRCKAGCRAASEQLGLSLNHPDPIINYMDQDPDFVTALKSYRKQNV